MRRVTPTRCRRVLDCVQVTFVRASTYVLASSIVLSLATGRLRGPVPDGASIVIPSLEAGLRGGLRGRPGRSAISSRCRDVRRSPEQSPLNALRNGSRSELPWAARTLIDETGSVLCGRHGGRCFLGVTNPRVSLIRGPLAHFGLSPRRRRPRAVGARST